MYFNEGSTWFCGLSDNSEYVLQDQFWGVLLAAAKMAAQAQPAYVVDGIKVHG